MTPEEFQTTLPAAQTGAEWALTALYRQHNPRVLRYLCAQEPVDHADIAAETWIDACRNLATFDGGEDAFAGWLFTIARRRLIDHRRARQRRPADAAPDHVLDSTRTAASAEDMALAAGALGDAEARRLVELLPEDQAEVVLLRVVAGLPVEAVAELTGRRPGTIRVVQHRALKRLAKELGPGRNEAGMTDDGTRRDGTAPHPPR